MIRDGEKLYDFGQVFADYLNKYPDLRAKEKNKYQHITGCKHIIKFAQYIFQRKSLIRRQN